MSLSKGYLLFKVTFYLLQRECQIKLEGNHQDEFYIAHSKFIGIDEDIYVVFTLGTHGNRVFLTATDGDPEEIGKILANLESYNCHEKKLRAGAFIQMPSKYLQSNGNVGVLLLRTKTLNILNEILDYVDIHDVRIRFSLVTFLNQSEYDCRKTYGHDALMDRFSEEGKDLISINNLLED